MSCCDEEIVLGAGDHVDNGVADAENVVLEVGMKEALCLGRAHYSGEGVIAKS